MPHDGVPQGWTPLHPAALQGNATMVEALLGVGASPGAESAKVSYDAMTHEYNNLVVQSGLEVNDPHAYMPNLLPCEKPPNVCLDW